VIDNIERKRKLLLDDLQALEGLEEWVLIEEAKTRKATMINDSERRALLEVVGWGRNQECCG